MREEVRNSVFPPPGEAFFTALIENMAEVVQVIDTGGTILYANPSVTAALGYAPEALPGSSAPALVHPEDRASWEEAVAAALRTRDAGTKPAPVRLRHANGTWRRMESVVKLMNGASGTSAYIVTFRDVTDREPTTEKKKLEDELRKSEERYRLLAENANDFIWISDLRGKFLYASPSSERFFGLTSSEVMQGNIEDFVTPESMARGRECVEQAWRRVAAGQPPGEIRYEIEAFHKNGSIVCHETNVSFVYNETGRVVALQGVSRDISERKRFEQALAGKAEELASSNAALQQFVYIASHDLQEPLRTIAGFTELLARRYTGKLDKDADEFIAYVVSGVKRMKDLIVALLDFSRVGTRAKPFVPTDCRAACGQAVDQLALAIAEHGAAVEVGSLPVVMADEFQVIQLFQNLIDNAVKFHGPEPPLVRISAERNNGEWIFAVRDNGIGIEPHYYDRIFAIFQQVHGRKEYPGTGIGLAVCRKIVERHGGRIWVESEVGKGTTFFFTLTAREGDAA